MPIGDASTKVSCEGSTCSSAKLISCEARTTLHKAKLTTFSMAKKPKIAKDAKSKSSQRVVLQTFQPLKKKSWFDDLPAAFVNMASCGDDPRRSQKQRQGVIPSPSITRF